MITVYPIGLKSILDWLFTVLKYCGENYAHKMQSGFMRSVLKRTNIMFVVGITQTFLMSSWQMFCFIPLRSARCSVLPPWRCVDLPLPLHLPPGQFLLEQSRLAEAAEMAERAAELDRSEFDVVFSAAHMLRLAQLLTTNPGVQSGTRFAHCTVFNNHLWNMNNRHAGVTEEWMSFIWK